MDKSIDRLIADEVFVTVRSISGLCGSAGERQLRDQLAFLRVICIRRPAGYSAAGLTAEVNLWTGRQRNDKIRGGDKQYVYI